MTSAVRPADELANLVTQAPGFLAGLVAVAYLMRQTEHQPTSVIAACGIYSLSLLLVYGCSSLSHLFSELPRRRLFRTLDQASIFLFMAGTYTPFGVLYLDDGAWLWLFLCMWGLAGLGVGRVWWVRDLSSSDKLFYGVIGLLPVTGLWEVARQAPDGVLCWILAGGACYALGAPFLCLSARVRYSHAAWHLLVMAGTACHYRAILLAVGENRG